MFEKVDDNMDFQSTSDNQNCFANILARLRESSKEAVVSADSTETDNYTMYMHVDRAVQDRFVSILKKLMIQMMQN